MVAYCQCNTVCLPAKMAFPGCFFPVFLEFKGAAAASFLRHVGYSGGLRLRSIFNLCSLSRQRQDRHYHGRSRYICEQRLFSLLWVRPYCSGLYLNTHLEIRASHHSSPRTRHGGNLALGLDLVFNIWQATALNPESRLYFLWLQWLLFGSEVGRI